MRQFLDNKKANKQDVYQLSSAYYKKMTEGFNPKAIEDETSLKERKKKYMAQFSKQYDSFCDEMAEKTLKCEDAFEIVCHNTAWMDAWILLTWRFVLAEEVILMNELLKSSDKQLAYLRQTLPQKIARKTELEQLLDTDSDSGAHMDSMERAYYKNSLRGIQAEIQEMDKELDTLEDIVPKISKKPSIETSLLNILLIFARGGYGRKELTFSSDIDLGYCINLSAASNIEIQTIKELVKRMEDLFQGIPLDIASQYFELGEDLSRFSETAALHTIPSILEGRGITGRHANLENLKNQILAVCPQEKMINYLKKQLDGLLPGTEEFFFIKEGYGGIRHIQYALWMVLIIINHEHGNSSEILKYLNENDWISEDDAVKLNQALELYFDLRNFIGLYDRFAQKLKKIGFEQLALRPSAELNYLDDQICMAYLKLKNRFTTVDFMDRFRLNSIQNVARLARSVVDDILDRTITERLTNLIVYKHLGTNQITHYQAIESNPLYRDKDSISTKDSHFVPKKDSFKEFFMDLANLMELFHYIAQTGNQLCDRMKDSFAEMIPELYQSVTTLRSDKIRQFVFDLFVAENTSSAIGQMMDIAAPMSREGNIQTLLGLFLPEVNQMRFLLRNTEIHEYPLCIHSLKSLGQVEEEIDEFQKNEPDLWQFIGIDERFALKWSTFFHDLGKINPYRNHEELGPVLSTKMLLRLGWSDESECLALIRLLVENHQSVIRFSQLSTFLDLGILKFFELAERDPGKVILLYLINISDFKSVNSEMNQKTAHIDSFFQKTISILSESREADESSSMTDVINNYLDRSVIEKRNSVLMELLLRQSCNRSLEDVVLLPIKRLSGEEAGLIEKNLKELENAVMFLKLAELDSSSLAKHRVRFIQIIKQAISERNLLEMAAPLTQHWNWFFTSVPNRFIVSSGIESLTSQLQEFEDSRYKKLRFSYLKGDPGEFDTILFHSREDKDILAKVAYALSWRGVNIENGKINKVRYKDETEGWVGFLKVSQEEGADILSNIELENVIANLVIPPLNPPPINKRMEASIQLQTYNETGKGYIVDELDAGRFDRSKAEFVAVKISLYDAPFCFYKLMRSLEAVGIYPQQVTVTTIGKQIIDYFYILPEEKALLDNTDFKSVLQKYVNAKISV